MSPKAQDLDVLRRVIREHVVEKRRALTDAIIAEEKARMAIERAKAILAAERRQPRVQMADLVVEQETELTTQQTQ